MQDETARRRKVAGWARPIAGRRELATGARAPLVLVLTLALGAGCATSPPPSRPPPPSPPPRPAPTDVPLNVLRNPGFEQGREGWTSIAGRNWGAFEIVESPVRSGRAAAHLPVHWAAGRPGQAVRVFGVVQEPAPTRFPEVVSGWYRVDRWEKGVSLTDLYVQVVVIAWNDPRAPRLVRPSSPDPSIRNYQLRYYLAGLVEPPFRLANARVVFVEKGPPALGEWVRFELPVRDDFERLWGTIPSGYEYLRMLFEARWDNKPEGTAVSADVYYDDLYAGPAAGLDAAAAAPVAGAR